MGLEELKAKIQKHAKGTHVSILSQSEIAADREVLYTPAYDLNRILSGSLFKGISNKTFTLFVGPEATGKSSFMCLCLAEAQRKGYTPIILDTEGAWTADFVTRWGMNPDNMLYVYTPWIDQIMVTLGQIIDSGDKKIALVVDSIGGLEKIKLVNDSVEGTPKADQGTLQKDIKRMLKMLLFVCKGRQSIAMGAGHYYGSPSQFGDGNEIGGGKFLKMAADVLVTLNKYRLYENPKGKSIKEKGAILGNRIKAYTVKNRYYPPFQSAVVEIDYRNGINSYTGMLDLAIEAGLASVGGSWYTINGEKYQGSINAEEGLKNDKTILDKLDKFLEETGYSTVNENIVEAQEIIEEEEKEMEEEMEEFEDELDKEIRRDAPVNGNKIESKIKLKKRG
jgi:RecA/RadA recombinase